MEKNYMHTLRIRKETYELIDEMNRKQRKELNNSIRDFINEMAVSITSRDSNMDIIDDEVIEEVVKEMENN